MEEKKEKLLGKEVLWRFVCLEFGNPEDPSDLIRLKK